jgi:hypothetical protein
MGCPVKRQLLEVLHEEIGDYQRQWRTRNHAINMLVELARDNEI